MIGLATWRRWMYLTGLCLLLADLVFFAVWQHVHAFTPCGGTAVGVETGLLCAFAAFAFSLFGMGWKRWMVALTAIVTFYFWFSWLAWLAQAKC